MTRSALAVALLVTLSACTKTIIQPAPIPAALTTCQRAPTKPTGDYTQRDVASYVVDLAEAGADCRAKVDALRVYNARVTKQDE